eukprot:TRINITY_DN28329_c0_g1_i1.p1 TRINITY_DN28329_c0_g1~~TRINITY_DN28329_c0_g1_i1.p1  ORF type:complete len:236 (+),score=31.71 TRINITY_DN28329_c0_g1_i1:51-710(+)
MYPRTQHLPFSPQVAEDDIVQATSGPLLGAEVIVTEKIDGGNCCLSDGKVFARTHSKEADHKSFDWVKGFYSQFSYCSLLAGLSLFGENMQAVHSIEYTGLKSFFYLFAVRVDEDQRWLSWDEMTTLVNKIETETGIAIPIVPVLYRGVFASLSDIQSWMENHSSDPSSIGGQREGFVIRITASFPESKFFESTGKYVRRGHIQTKSDWKRTWQSASLK